MLKWKLNKKMRIYKLLLSGFIFLLSFSSHRPLNAASIIIDPAIEYQTIENFGASDAWSCGPVGERWDPKVKEEIADLLFSRTKGIGLSLWRFNIGVGIVPRSRIRNRWRTVECFWDGHSYDWTKQAGQRWFLRAAKKRGVKYFLAFCNSPPKSMTKNGYTNCDDVRTHSTNLADGSEGKFAAFLCDVIEHFKNNPDPAERIYFDFVSPVNEPCWEWNVGCNQEGCRYNNEDIKRVINALYSELQARHLTTKIIGVEAGEPKANWTIYKRPYPGTYGNYIKVFLGDPDMRRKLSFRLSGHSYWQDSIHEIKEARQKLAALMANYPGCRYWMTEWCCLGSRKCGQRDLTMDFAIQMARVIHYDLTAANASAWHFWTAISKEHWRDGLIYVDEGVYDTFYVAKTLWALGNYSRFIRPGSKRIYCAGADDRYSLMASAYKDETNKNLIIVFVNAATSNHIVKFTFRNVSGLRRLTPYVTDSANNLSKKSSISPCDSYIIPARSVVTLVGAYRSIAKTSTSHSHSQ